MARLLPFARCLMAAAVTIGVPSAARAQLQFFGTIGTFDGGSDEGSYGSGRSLGGGGSVARGRWLIEADAQTARTSRNRSAANFYRTRSQLAIVSLLYRWDHPRYYVFAGGGLGGEHREFIWREDNFADGHIPEAPWVEVAPRVYEWRGSKRQLIKFAPRAGIVYFPKPWLGVRVDAYLASWHRGIRAGMTIRP